MTEADQMPLGFDREAARIGVCLNGFYLFVAFSPILPLKSHGADHLPLRPIQSLDPTRPEGILSPLEILKNPSYHQRCQGFG
jgi:hypothetical protein